MNKRVKTLTTRFARDTETQSCHERKYKCGVYFVHAGTRDQNKRHGFLKEYVEGEELIIPPLACPELCRRAPGMAPRNRCGIFNSGTPELQIPQHFFSSLCLRASSEAGGESLHIAQVVI
jgi:hypothetical protein